MIEVVECGCCGHYHPAPLKGDLYQDDCRYDANRLTAEQMDNKYGASNWLDVTEDEEFL